MSSAVAEALRVVVRDHGWRVADRPDRVRALLSDALGAATRENRAEVDALVVAAEEGVPALLLGEGPLESLVAEARRRLLDRGLDDPTSTASLLTWGETLELPTSSLSATTPPQESTDPLVPQRSGGVLSPSSQPDEPVATQLPEVPEVREVREVPAPSPPDVAVPRTGEMPPRTRGPRLTASAVRYVAAAVGALALVGGVVGLQALWPDGAGSADGGTPRASTAGAAGGTLRLLSTTDLTWDPMATTDPGLRLAMNRLLNRGLVAFAPTGGDVPATLVADLATDTGRTTDRGLTWQFTLRQGVRWEDAQPVTCADAKAGLKRAADHADLFGYAYEASTLLDLELDSQGLPVRTGAAAGVFDRAVSCSGQILSLRLREARLDFPRFLALPELAPYRQGAEVAGKGRRWLSNGPYVVDVTTTTTTVGRLVRNARWDRASDPLRTALPDTVEVTAGLTAAAIVDRIRTDDAVGRTAASLSPLPAASATQELADEGDRTQVAPNGAVEVLVPNFSRPAMRDTELRKALAATVARGAYCAAYGGNASRLELRTVAGVHLNGSVKLDPGALDTYLGRGESTRKVVVAYHSTPQADIAMKALTEPWSRGGLSVSLKPFTGDKLAYYQHVASPAGRTAYDLVRYDLLTPIDPVAETSALDSRFTTGQPTEGFRDPELDRLRDVARTTLDPTARLRAWDDVRKRATSQAAVIPIAAEVSFVAHGSQLRDVHTLNEFGGVVDPVRVSVLPPPKETS